MLIRENLWLVLFWLNAKCQMPGAECYFGSSNKRCVADSATADFENGNTNV